MNDFDNQNYIMEHLQQIASGISNRVKIIDTIVDTKVQTEFFELINQVKEIPKNLEDLNRELNSAHTDIARKKIILATLAIIGEVEPFRFLEKYLDNVEQKLKSIAFLAHQHAKMVLESKLMNEDFIVFVASGLGGKNGCLRFIFVLVSKNEEINETQKKIIDGELEYILNNNGVTLENKVYAKKYVITTVLTPIFSNLVYVVENIITEINQYGNFLERDIFITNEKLLTPKNIDAFINKKTSSER